MDTYTGQGHGHGHGHGHGPVTPAGAGHGTLKDYVVGFVLSVILTAAAFIVVMAHVMPPQATIYTIAALAAVQVMVHLVCFLHLSTASAQRWNVTAMAFAIVVVAVLIVGSLWIMHNMSEHMMGGDDKLPPLQLQP
jgi:cytochrome o ubiquinol oxidase operon protein cyoD